MHQKEKKKSKKKKSKREEKIHGRVRRLNRNVRQLRV
jgi:hypothetical protein